MAALAPPIGNPATPGNNVRCVFDNLSIEDREIVLMLIGLDYQSRGRYSRVPPKNAIVDRLIDEAVPKCVQAFKWNPAATAASVEYARSTLVLEVLRQAIVSEDHEVEPVEAFFVDQRRSLAGKTELDDLMEERFASHLKGNGWRESERGARRMARVYLENLITRESSELAFASAMPHVTAKPKVKPKAKRARRAQ